MCTKITNQVNNISLLPKNHIDLGDNVRTKMVQLLNQALADTADLYTQTKHAHWNVKGSQFMQLHKLFDMLAEGVHEYIDVIAERATALGGVAFGTARMVAAASSLPETAFGSASGTYYLKHLIILYRKKAKDVRAAINAADKAGDMGTSDLFNEYVTDLDKWRWFLDTHLDKSKDFPTK